MPSEHLKRFFREVADGVAAFKDVTLEDFIGIVGGRMEQQWTGGKGARAQEVKKIRDAAFRNKAELTKTIDDLQAQLAIAASTGTFNKADMDTKIEDLKRQLATATADTRLVQRASFTLARAACAGGVVRLFGPFAETTINPWWLAQAFARARDPQRALSQKPKAKAKRGSGAPLRSRPCRTLPTPLLLPPAPAPRRL